jgi:hypothetical protein
MIENNHFTRRLETQSHHTMLLEFVKHALVQTSFVFEDWIT